MRKVILSIQMTLDGFMCGPNNEMDWLLAGDDEWAELLKELESVDTCLVGRKMFPEYSGYWQSLLTKPNANKDEFKYAQYAVRTPHVVFSKSGSVKTDWTNARIADDPGREISRLKQQPGKNIIAWGGAGFALSLGQLGLIDEYRIVLNPNLIGGGKSPFHPDGLKRKLRFIDAKPMKSGNIILHYRST